MYNFTKIFIIVSFAKFFTIASTVLAMSPEKSERIHTIAASFLIEIQENAIISKRHGVKRILKDNEREQLFDELFSCSYYSYKPNWRQEDLKVFRIGHPIFASSQLLEDLSVGRLATNGCQSGKTYSFYLKGLNYEKIFELLLELKSLDHNQRVAAINAAIFELVSNKKLGKDTPERVKFAFDIASTKVSGYDPSDIIKWGQALLKERGFNILVDGDFGPKTCQALSEAFAKNSKYSCSKTFRLEEIMFLIFGE